MNEKTIKKQISNKLKHFIKSIDDAAVQEVIKKDAIVTGGSIVSLLLNEDVNDYDVYFRTKESLITVAKYYADKIKDSNIQEENDRVSLFIKSKGIYKQKTENEYAVVHVTSNAITLNDKIQIVLRFWGDVDKLHESFDFVHCTCSYDWHNDKLTLPNDALIAIINKTLKFKGSLYPLSAIIRTKKFIKRGWKINAGQYVKMAILLNELDLKKKEVLKEQLIGVDMLYFDSVISSFEDVENLDASYLIQKINEVFD